MQALKLGIGFLLILAVSAKRKGKFSIFQVIEFPVSILNIFKVIVLFFDFIFRMHPVLGIEPGMAHVSQVMNVTKEVEDLKEVVLKVMEFVVSVSLLILTYLWYLIEMERVPKVQVSSDYE